MNWLATRNMYLKAHVKNQGDTFYVQQLKLLATLIVCLTAQGNAVGIGLW